MQGGDWWDSLLNNFKDPSVTFWLRLLEKSPHIILHMANAAISPHLLFDITSKVVTQGPMALCDNKMFELSKYVYEENIVSILHEFCDMESKMEENKLAEIQVLYFLNLVLSFYKYKYFPDKRNILPNRHKRKSFRKRYRRPSKVFNSIS